VTRPRAKQALAKAKPRQPPPKRGEVWVATLDPVAGHEQAGRRPVLVISVDAFNANPAELATVLPITTNKRQVMGRIAVRPPNGGLASESRVICEQCRTVSHERLVQRLGMLDADTIAQVSDSLRIVLGL
jgi:mRNA interferase MazF